MDWVRRCITAFGKTLAVQDMDNLKLGWFVDKSKCTTEREIALLTPYEEAKME